MPHHWLEGRCTHVSNKPYHSTDYREDATPGTNNKPCHSTDYREDVTPGTNNKPWYSTDYREDVHMYLINHACAKALTTGKMLLRGLIVDHASATALTTGKMLPRELIIKDKLKTIGRKTCWEFDVYMLTVSYDIDCWKETK